MKRCFAVLLALLLALTSVSLAEESKYKTEWDLTDLYASDDAWHAACDDAFALLTKMKRMRLRAAKTQSGFRDFMELDAVFWEEASRLYVYEALLLSLDPAHKAGKQMAARYDQLESQYSQIASYVYQEDWSALDALVKVQNHLASAYNTLTYSEIPSIPDLANAENPYAPFLNTYASLLNAKMSAYAGYAQAIGYSSSMDYALDVEQLPRQAYAMALSANEKNMDLLQRYVALRRRGADCLQKYGEEFTYDEAVEDVLRGVSFLGTDYVQTLEDFLCSGHVDAFPSVTKPGYSFSLSTGADDLPYVLLQFSGGTKDVCVAAHEFGHAMYDLYTDQAQNFENANVSTYIHEVASMTNEFLYYFYRFDNAQSDAEKQYLLDDALYNIYFNVLFSSAALAQMEAEMYALVEQGSFLGADSIGVMYDQVWTKLAGDELLTAGDLQNLWPAESQLFLYSYYMMDYVMAVSYAADIAQRIYEGQEGALEDYLAFLTLGSTMDAPDLLLATGVDVMNASTYETVYEMMDCWLDAYEDLLD